MQLDSSIINAEQTEMVRKGIMPDLIDPNHEYVFRTGDHGVFSYWYIDTHGNYWKYTNAPEDHPDYDACGGVPLLVRTQPTPSSAPAFFTPEGRKRHIAVPPGIIPDRNPEYDTMNPRKLWYEVFAVEGHKRYVYLDSVVRENLDLFVQYQLRLLDASLPRMRRFAVELFQKQHPKDRIVGALLMLMDQCLYSLDELIEATVSDLDFIDETVKLLGRKFRCDLGFLDFLTSLVGDRDPDASLFQVDTAHGTSPIGEAHLASILGHLGIDANYLLTWHASHMFSRVVNRLASEGVPPEDVEGAAFSEVQRAFASHQDVQFLVDFKVRLTLVENYKNAIGKGIGLHRLTSDDIGVHLLVSDLASRKEDEMEFSAWLHAEPLHDVTPEEEMAVDEGLADDEPEDGAESPADLTDAGDRDIGVTDAGDRDIGATGVEG